MVCKQKINAVNINKVVTMMMMMMTDIIKEAYRIWEAGGEQAEEHSFPNSSYRRQSILIKTEKWMTMFSAPTYFLNLLFLYFKEIFLKLVFLLAKEIFVWSSMIQKFYCVYLLFSPKIKLKIVFT